MKESGTERKQVLKSEQIAPNKNLVLDYDQPLLSSKDIFIALKNSLGENVISLKYQGKMSMPTSMTEKLNIFFAER